MLCGGEARVRPLAARGNGDLRLQDSCWKCDATGLEKPRMQPHQSCRRFADASRPCALGVHLRRNARRFERRVVGEEHTLAIARQLVGPVRLHAIAVRGKKHRRSRANLCPHAPCDCRDRYFQPERKLHSAFHRRGFHAELHRVQTREDVAPAAPLRQAFPPRKPIQLHVESARLPARRPRLGAAAILPRNILRLPTILRRSHELPNESCGRRGHMARGLRSFARHS